MNRYEFYSNLQTYKKEHEDDSLTHYGIIGQKWGNRRWQNQDGTFNEAGKERYFGSKGNKKEKVDGKTGKSSKNKWSMNDLFKKAGYDYDNSDDETRELFEMEINDIRNSYKNGNDINKLSKKFGYDKNFIQDVVNSDPDQKIGSFKVNFKKSSDNSDLGTRTFYTRDEYNKTLNKLDNKYGDDYYPTMSNDEYRKMYEETPMYGQNKKVGGLFSKKSKINPKYQNEDGSLTEEGKEFFAQNNDKKIKKNIDMDKYHAWKDEMTKDNIFDDFEKLNDFAKDLGIEPASGRYSWENNMRTVLKTNKELFDTIEGRKAISDNVDNIKKLSKALDDHDMDTYNSVLSEINEKDKTTIDLFTKKIKDVKDWYEEAEETMNEVNSSQTQNIKKYMENIWGDPKIRYEKSDYHNEGKVSYPGKYDLEDYVKGNSKASKSIKELDKNADVHFDKILDKLYNNLMNFSGTLDVWDEDHNKLTKSEFKNYMKDQKNKLINSGSVSDNGNINLYLNDANLYWGHVFGIDYNPLTGEFNYRGIEG